MLLNVFYAERSSCRRAQGHLSFGTGAENDITTMLFSVVVAAWILPLHSFFFSFKCFSNPLTLLLWGVRGFPVSIHSLESLSAKTWILLRCQYRLKTHPVFVHRYIDFKAHSGEVRFSEHKRSHSGWKIRVEEQRDWLTATLLFTTPQHLFYKRSNW